MNLELTTERLALRDAVRGGIGFTWIHDAHPYVKRLLTWSAFLGGSNRYRQEIGARLAQAAHTSRST
jgi:hypothetical protein